MYCGAAAAAETTATAAMVRKCAARSKSGRATLPPSFLCSSSLSYSTISPEDDGAGPRGAAGGEEDGGTIAGPFADARARPRPSALPLNSFVAVPYACVRDTDSFAGRW